MNRCLDKCAQMCWEFLGMLSRTLHGIVNGGATLELRLDRIGFDLDEKTRENANTLYGERLDHVLQCKKDDRTV